MSGIVKLDVDEKPVLTKDEQALESSYQKAITTPMVSTAKSMAELEEAEQKFDPMMAPAGMFGLYLPKFIEKIDTLSNKSLRRVMRALVAYPLEELHPHKNNPDEVFAYKVGEKLQEAKYIMILHTAVQHQMELEQKKMEEQQKKNSETQVADSTQEQVAPEPNKQEETNG